MTIQQTIIHGSSFLYLFCHLFAVEVCLLDISIAEYDEVKQQVREYILKIISSRIHAGLKISGFWNNQYLRDNVLCIKVTDIEYSEEVKNGRQESFDPSIPYELCIHIYHLNDECSQIKLENDDQTETMFKEILLPSSEFEGYWDNLMFEDDVKQRMIKYAETSLLFSDLQVDTSIIGLNRVILLHGEPGTGKTTLCKSVAQKTTIRLSDRFSHGYFIEVHTQSLFSKWFSESGKILTKMFDKLQELVSDKQALVFVLIDEVESIAASRSACINGSEPSDSLRMVNTLLTQIDRLRKENNCLIMATSNFSESIDLAFIDRADMKIHIGLPTAKARYSILTSCIDELSRVKLLSPSVDLLEPAAVALFNQIQTETLDLRENEQCSSIQASKYLWKISLKCQDKSGRTLRKLPFMAFMKAGTHKMTLVKFLRILETIIE